MKHKRFTLLITAVAGIFIAGVFLFGSKAVPPTVHTNEQGAKHELTVYQSPTCGCCPNWVSYMRIKGYEVNVIKTEDMDSVKADNNIPDSLFSCHTTLVNGGQYFIEGHMPEEAVRQLLDEEPAIAGIGLPGMPSASPGMPGDKMGPFEIMQVDEQFQIKSYMSL